MGRPRGEIRQAVESWASTWRPGADKPGLACHEIAAELPGLSALSGGDVAAVRETVRAMCNAGTLRRAGTVRKEGANRPVLLFAPVEQPGDPAGAALDALGLAWFGAPGAARGVAGQAARVDAQQLGAGQAGAVDVLQRDADRAGAVARVRDLSPPKMVHGDRSGPAGTDKVISNQ